MAVMRVGGNILRRVSWFTAAVITPAVTLVAGSTFFAVILWRNSFAGILEQVGTNPIIVAVFTGAIILILAKSTKYALFDLTKEMAYIPLDEDMKVKGKVVVEVVGGRLGKASGAWLQMGLLTAFGYFSSKYGFFGGGKIELPDIAPCLFGILVLVCVVWILAVGALSRRISAMTATLPKGANN
jgi:AAA family ATP:ADP antiporter